MVFTMFCQHHPIWTQHSHSLSRSSLFRIQYCWFKNVYMYRVQFSYGKFLTLVKDSPRIPFLLYMYIFCVDITKHMATGTANNQLCNLIEYLCCREKQNDRDVPKTVCILRRRICVMGNFKEIFSRSLCCSCSFRWISIWSGSKLNDIPKNMARKKENDTTG